MSNCKITFNTYYKEALAFRIQSKCLIKVFQIIYIIIEMYVNYSSCDWWVDYIETLFYYKVVCVTIINGVCLDLKKIFDEFQSVTLL